MRGGKEDEGKAEKRIREGKRVKGKPREGCGGKEDEGKTGRRMREGRRMKGKPGEE